MKFSLCALSAALLAPAYCRPSKRGIDPALVPPFGVQRRVNLDGRGDCQGIDGPDGIPIEIPCTCPPDRDSFIQELSANVVAGHVLTNPSVGLIFPADNSTGARLSRLNAASDTLLNLVGAGVGCPIESTTFTAQRDAIVNDEAPPPSMSFTITATFDSASPSSSPSSISVSALIMASPTETVVSGPFVFHNAVLGSLLNPVGPVVMITVTVMASMLL